MARASDRDNRIAGNIYARVSSHLGDDKCEPFISDMKLYIAPNLFYYPDVMVTCDPPGGDAYFRTQPVLLVDVLSRSTERADRRGKMMAYRAIPSLQEYAIVLPDQIQIEVHRRTSTGWQAEIYDKPDQELVFNSIDLTLTVADIYRNVRFESNAN